MCDLKIFRIGKSKTHKSNVINVSGLEISYIPALTASNQNFTYNIRIVLSEDSDMYFCVINIMFKHDLNEKYPIQF